MCVCVCVFCSFTPFLSVLFAFNRKRLVNRYMTFTSELFLKRKDIVEIKFLISLNYSFIHLSGGANIYLYGCVSLLAPESTLRVCVCVISNQSASKKPHYL